MKLIPLPAKKGKNHTLTLGKTDNSITKRKKVQHFNTSEIVSNGMKIQVFSPFSN